MATNGPPQPPMQQQTSTSLAGPTGPGYQQSLGSGTSSTGGQGGSGAAHEFLEFGTTTLSWTVNNLKTLFEGSKGDSKSRVVKSCAFGGSRWTVLLYANAGGSANDYCSLYLSCEPAPEEYEDPPGLVPPTPTPAGATHQPSASGSGSGNGLFGKWTREGTYQFKFVINGPDGKTVCVKEAANHTFASKTANWGWAQFAKRDTVYFNAPSSKSADYFTVVCSIWSIPKPPALPDPIPKEVVPKSLLHSVGKLLDDQMYSDVEFVIARKGKRKETRIWANKTLLSRADYFSTMLSSGFAEDFADQEDDATSVSGTSQQSSVYLPNLEDSDSDSDSDTHQDSSPSSPESSDDEDEGSASFRSHSDHESASLNAGAPHGSSDQDVSVGEGIDAAAEDPHHAPQARASGSDLGSGGLTPRGGTGFGASEKEGEELVEREVQGEVQGACEANASVGQRRASSATVEKQRQEAVRREKQTRLGPRKTRIVVRDASYPTFFALLYYLYTDHIVFAPLTSSFVTTGPSTSSTSPRRAREAWIAQWMRMRPGRPRPASAKSVFVLADKMGLTDLKTRAFNHIVAGLTVADIPYEAFSAFSAAFDEVRKVEVEFFLKNWNEIKRTEGMRDIWSHIRTGRHRGFEEVWPLIISQLEFVAMGAPTGESPSPVISL